jgi:hypothetical protein
MLTLACPSHGPVHVHGQGGPVGQGTVAGSTAGSYLLQLGNLP